MIVVPDASLVTRGPYQYLRHPNYLGVIGELVGVALLAGAPVARPLGICCSSRDGGAGAGENRALRQPALDSLSLRTPDSPVGSTCLEGAS